MANSPSSATPTSAASPPNLTSVPSVAPRPSLCMKPMPAASVPATTGGSPIGSLTSKEWVIPPRPKPGRKPATDTPPTKRKAQNRAAQRAFRERRAARVGELEEQLKQIEDEFDQKEDTLNAEIARLEQDVERYRTELSNWVERYKQLEREISNSAPQQPSDTNPRPEQQPEPISVAHEHAIGCGNCSLDTPCQCIDDVVSVMSGSAQGNERARSERAPSSNHYGSRAKRIKVEAADAMEIDFTSAFSRPRVSISREEAMVPVSALPDPCGFCQDGTPCICAEMAAEAERRSNNEASGNRHLSQFTPPPSEGDVVHTIPAPSGPLTSGPGTCAQCRADPNSTLFCKSLAASRAQAGLPAGCCGGQSASGGCCQMSVPLPARSVRSNTAGRVQLPPINAPKQSITLSCADAYTTLSRHPAYEKASGEIADWLPKLHANPNNVGGRPALEIDAANVMAVLKDFDRRFGADK